MTETTPELACSLDSEARKDRRAFFRDRLLADAVRTIRTENGLRIIFRNDPAVRSEIETLVDLERQCCGFLDFELVEDQEQLTLTITGPRAARGVLDQMASVAAMGQSDGAAGGSGSLLKYTGLAGVSAGVACLLACELPVVLTVIGLSGLGAWFAYFQPGPLIEAFASTLIVAGSTVYFVWRRTCRTRASAEQQS